MLGVGRVEGGRERSQVVRCWRRGFWRGEGGGGWGEVDCSDGGRVARMIAAAWCCRPVCSRIEILTSFFSVRVSSKRIVVGTRYWPS